MILNIDVNIYCIMHFMKKTFYIKLILKINVNMKFSLDISSQETLFII